MQHSAYASADKSLKVLPRSGSQLQEIHPEPGHQFCPIWLLTNPWQLHVAVLASAFEILSMTCTFMLVLSQKNRRIVYVHMGSFVWFHGRMTKMPRKEKKIWAKLSTLNHISPSVLQWTYTAYIKACGVQSYHLHSVAAQSIKQMNN